jgi:hypothetical protein
MLTGSAAGESRHQAAGRQFADSKYVAEISGWGVRFARPTVMRCSTLATPIPNGGVLRSLKRSSPRLGCRRNTIFLYRNGDVLRSRHEWLALAVVFITARIFDKLLSGCRFWRWRNKKRVVSVTWFLVLRNDIFGGYGFWSFLVGFLGSQLDFHRRTCHDDRCCGRYRPAI